MTLVPAYGRDYKSKAEVIADFEADRDFQIADVSSPDNGRYANRTDLKGSGERSVKVRYAKLASFVMIPIPR